MIKVTFETTFLTGEEVASRIVTSGILGGLEFFRNGKEKNMSCREAREFFESELIKKRPFSFRIRHQDQFFAVILDGNLHELYLFKTTHLKIALRAALAFTEGFSFLRLTSKPQKEEEDL